MNEIEAARQQLQKKFADLDDKKAILKAVELKALFEGIKTVPTEKRGEYGKAVNELKNEVQSWIDEQEEESTQIEQLDVTAPWGVNTDPNKRPKLLPYEQGSQHPLTKEIEAICEIYQRMGFIIEESREIDDDYHMFESLNFPEDHPARDDYDTFMTDEGLIAPAHTSTMQNRVLRKFRNNLNNDEPIAVVIPDRVFRNEDLDATHEHTFYQIEGVYVGKGITVGNLIATLSAFMNEYFGQELKTKLQPFYFPFTEPSFEFAIERPDVLKKNDSEEQKWLELLGCGMIHPNVLRAAEIDPEVYTGFAWGNGIERMVMMKQGIEDVRHFESANLKFLRQFR
jgi:phenylalanyl-tRNA synthetase alpha chain